MARFQYTKKESSGRNLLLTIAGFILIIGIFYFGISSVSSKTDSEQRDSLERALTRSITSCYAVEGSYPESLDYIEEHYKLSYDKDKYYIDYRPSGANIIPDVTIIEKGE